MHIDTHLFSWTRLLIVSFVVGLGMTVAPQAAQGQDTYVVDSNGDADDANPGDGTCATSGGNCTLRAAIQEANTTSNNDDIEFAIPQTGNFTTITLSTQLTVTESVTIDGTLSPEYPSSIDGPAIEIDGSSLPGFPPENAFMIDASNVTIRGLAVNNASNSGIQINAGATGVLIEDCFIGIAPDDGSTDRGNAYRGIAANGDDFYIDNNVVSNNEYDGIYIDASNGIAVNNTIGLGHDGVVAAGNGRDGIRIAGGAGNAIGACFLGCVGNTISANDSTGIRIGSETAADNNTIVDNYIGTDLNAENDLGNGSDGIRIEGGTGNTVEGNVVGNSTGASNGEESEGIEVLSDGNTIVGNLIGTNENGDDLGNRNAIRIDGGSNNTIGGTNSGDGNVMAFSIYTSFMIREGADGNIVQGNYIGTNSSDEDFGGGGIGIRIYKSSNNIIGYGYGASDMTTGAANTIAYNRAEALRIRYDVSTGNAVRGNSFYSNEEIGIELGIDGVTANDVGDTDTGPNNLQNFPEIDQSQTQYNEDTGKVEVRYKVDSNPGDATYDIKVDFYLADSESSGEGKTYIGTDTYPEAEAGSFRSVAFAPSDGVTVTRSDHIVATATDADGNTSEFTSNVQALPVELVSFEATRDGDEAVQLTWQTASETDNAGFEVEHKPTDAEAFEQVGFVEGAGTTSEAQSYHHEVADVETGTHVFRLKQVDRDGTHEYSSEVEVAVSMSEAYELAAPYPNPARGQATLKLTVRERQPVTVALYNTLGQRVHTLYEGTPAAETTKTLTVDGSKLSSGLYLLRVKGKRFSTTETVTFVK